MIIPDEEHKPHITIKDKISKEVITTPVIFNPAGAARSTDAAFARCVPSVSMFSDPDVILITNIGIDILLPAGAFYVASYFNVGGVFTQGSTDVSMKCIARYTMLRADEDKLTITVNTKSYQLKSGDFVFIENASIDDIATPGDHWAKYAKVLGGSKKLAKYKKGLPQEDCLPVNTGDHLGKLPTYSQDQKKDDAGDLAAASSECTNSQWP